METDTKKVLRWVGIVALVIILMNLAGCAVATQEAPIITGNLAPPNLGVTVCSENNLPVIVIKEEVPPIPLREVIIFHEQHHVRQIQAFGGGCKRFMNLYKQSKAFRVGKELDAYCASMDFAVNELGANGKAVLDDIEKVMRFHFDTTLTCGGKYESPTQRADGTHTNPLPKHGLSRGPPVSSLRHNPKRDMD